VRDSHVFWRCSSESAGEANEAVRLWSKCPKHHRSNTQSFGSHSATRGSVDGGEESYDDGDSTSEVRARRGPKHRISTPQEAKATYVGAAANHKNIDDGTNQSKPVKPWRGRVSAYEDPAVADLHPKA
jgi:hypothetical protein